jgi:hypothetical protein
MKPRNFRITAGIVLGISFGLHFNAIAANVDAPKTFLEIPELPAHRNTRLSIAIGHDHGTTGGHGTSGTHVSTTSHDNAGTPGNRRAHHTIETCENIFSIGPTLSGHSSDSANLSVEAQDSTANDTRNATNDSNKDSEAKIAATTKIWEGNNLELRLNELIAEWKKEPYLGADLSSDQKMSTGLKQISLMVKRFGTQTQNAHFLATLVKVSGDRGNLIYNDTASVIDNQFEILDLKSSQFVRDLGFDTPAFWKIKDDQFELLYEAYLKLLANEPLLELEFKDPKISESDYIPDSLVAGLNKSTAKLLAASRWILRTKKRKIQDTHRRKLAFFWAAGWLNFRTTNSPDEKFKPIVVNRPVFMRWAPETLQALEERAIREGRQKEPTGMAWSKSSQVSDFFSEYKPHSGWQKITAFDRYFDFDRPFASSTVGQFVLPELAIYFQLPELKNFMSVFTSVATNQQERLLAAYGFSPRGEPISPDTQFPLNSIGVSTITSLSIPPHLSPFDPMLSPCLESQPGLMVAFSPQTYARLNQANSTPAMTTGIGSSSVHSPSVAAQAPGTTQPPVAFLASMIDQTKLTPLKSKKRLLLRSTHADSANGKNGNNNLELPNNSTPLTSIDLNSWSSALKSLLNTSRVLPSKELRSEMTRYKKQLGAMEPMNEADRSIGLRFVDFFSHLNKTYFERQYLIEGLKSTFLERGTFLMISKPGTGKSAVTDHVGENITQAKSDEPSFFSYQLTPDASVSEVLGGIIQELYEKGIVRRNVNAGVHGHRIVFLDEFFEAPLRFLKHFLKAFNERKLTQGGHTDQSQSEVFIAATNRTLPDIYAKYDGQHPGALIDRFFRVVYVSPIIEKMSSVFRLRKSPSPQSDHSSAARDSKGSSSKQSAPLTFGDLNHLQSRVDTVAVDPLLDIRTTYFFYAMRSKAMEHAAIEMAAYSRAIQNGEAPIKPYQPTRYFSPRSLGIAINLIVKSTVLRRSLAQIEKTRQLEDTKFNGPRLIAESEDVDQALREYLIMQGPDSEILERLSNTEIGDQSEMAQLDNLKFERESLNSLFETVRLAQTQLASELNLNTTLNSLFNQNMQHASNSMALNEQLQNSFQRLNSIIHQLQAIIKQADHPESITPRQAAAATLLHKIYARLSQVSMELAGRQQPPQAQTPAGQGPQAQNPQAPR